MPFNLREKNKVKYTHCWICDFDAFSEYKCFKCKEKFVAVEIYTENKESDNTYYEFVHPPGCVELFPKCNEAYISTGRVGHLQIS